ncbi:hypothetical protein GF360_02545 [candidate division WWE3 bacterium]|nr:hypothetical protein [candidate division WWE3 bacterium]
MVKHALHSLGYAEEAAEYNHIAYGVVSLSKDTAEALGVEVSDDKEVYAMSGRKGIGVKVTDLLDLLCKEISQIQRKSGVDLTDPDLASSQEIALAAIKHYMLKNNPYTPILFDYKQALKLVGNTGPYLQYSHARACSILKKFEPFDTSCTKGAELASTEEALLKDLESWPFIVGRVLEDFNLAILSEYAFTLAQSFHTFYEHNNVSQSEGSVKNFRLTLILAFTKVMQEVLQVMGISAPKRM